VVDHIHEHSTVTRTEESPAMSAAGVWLAIVAVLAVVFLIWLFAFTGAFRSSSPSTPGGGVQQTSAPVVPGGGGTTQSQPQNQPSHT
jgi:hypothetical protein